jgi:NitT/TauT family transport system substrate-binding protein
MQTGGNQTEETMGAVQSLPCRRSIGTGRPSSVGRHSRTPARRSVMLVALGIASVAVYFCVAGVATAADVIRIAAQKTGTLAWELDIIRAHGLDKAANLDIKVVELASTEAGKIALRSGSADMIVSDWLWVARERSLGDNLVFYPYTSTLGAVMVPGNSAIAGLADLKGKKLAIAGGPLDKSWLMLQAVARRDGLDLNTQAKIVYGAPPLLSQKALQRENDATLTFWNFCAELEAQGFKRAIEMEAIGKRLGAEGPVAMVGYAFDAGWAARNRSAVGRYLDIAAKAKEILAASETEWQHLASRIGVADKAGLDIYRRRYSEGIPRRPIGQEEHDATGLYRVLAEVGGTELVGPAREIAAGTFYDPGKTD